MSLLNLNRFKFEQARSAPVQVCTKVFRDTNNKNILTLCIVCITINNTKSQKQVEQTQMEERYDHSFTGRIGDTGL